jgi:hypothetical protein
MKDIKPADAIGCFAMAVMLPASVLWYILLGLILRLIDAGQMEWMFFIAYLILGSIGLSMSVVGKLMVEGNK